LAAGEVGQRVNRTPHCPQFASPNCGGQSETLRGIGEIRRPEPAFRVRIKNGTRAYPCLNTCPRGPVVGTGTRQKRISHQYERPRLLSSGARAPRRRPPAADLPGRPMTRSCRWWRRPGARTFPLRAKLQGDCYTGGVPVPALLWPFENPLFNQGTPRGCRCGDEFMAARPLGCADLTIHRIAVENVERRPRFGRDRSAPTTKKPAQHRWCRINVGLRPTGISLPSTN